MGQATQGRLTYQEYLQLEADTGLKHEFLDGVAVALSGGSLGGSFAHAALTARWIGLVHAQLRGSPCLPTSGDLRVRTGTGLNTYPDLAVVCGPHQAAADDPHAHLNPTVVVEVLSPSTESWDRGEKLRHYMSVPALQDIVLCSQHQPAVWHYARVDEETWSVRVAGPGGQVRLLGCEVVVEVDELYEGIELTEAPARPTA